MRRSLLYRIGTLAAGCAGLLGLFGPANAQESGGVVDNRLVSANTRFGFKLFAKLVEQDRDKNIFASPASVAMVLTMTYNGAEGETRQAMAQTLELQGMTLPEINHANAQLKAVLENPDPKVQLAIANSLWARKGIPFKPAFIKVNKDFYGAEVTDLNFSQPNAASAINDWVSRKTKGKIDKIIDVIDRDAILFLINAIYFKGTWTAEFDKTKTKEDAFHLLDGRQKKHPMMSQSGHYRYYRGQDFQAISLPYGKERVSMYIFLPDKDHRLEEFLRGLNAENWETWMSKFRKTEGTIVLPRFKLEYEVDLNDALKALGLGVAFTGGRANFQGMFSKPQDAYINKVKHKTYVEVNEEGTEAAAVTSVEMRATSVQIEPPPFRMIVDRPFFCAIRDNKSGTILFMGAIVEPK